jgi:hypothetical protein
LGIGDRTLEGLHVVAFGFSNGSRDLIGAPVAKTAVVAAAVTPGPSPVAKTAVVAAAVTPGRGRRRI